MPTAFEPGPVATASTSSGVSFNEKANNGNATSNNTSSDWDYSALGNSLDDPTIMDILAASNSPPPNYATVRQALEDVLESFPFYFNNPSRLDQAEHELQAYSIFYVHQIVLVPADVLSAIAGLPPDMAVQLRIRAETLVEQAEHRARKGKGRA